MAALHQQQATVEQEMLRQQAKQVKLLLVKREVHLGHLLARHLRLEQEHLVAAVEVVVILLVEVVAHLASLQVEVDRHQTAILEVAHSLWTPPLLRTRVSPLWCPFLLPTHPRDMCQLESALSSFSDSSTVYSLSVHNQNIYSR